jgi:hypothetical protein
MSSPILFYSVDRRGFYKAGEFLNLSQSDPRSGAVPFLNSHLNWFTGDDLRQHIRDMFPDGLSLHGWQFTVCHHLISTDQNGVRYTHNECAIELVFEYARRATFPGCPSRFQSFFAWDSLDAAKAFNKASHPIYQLESEASFRADSAWLNLNEQNAIGSYSAHRYWSGAPTPEPKWEYLLKPPVRVVEQVG